MCTAVTQYVIDWKKQAHAWPGMLGHTTLTVRVALGSRVKPMSVSAKCTHVGMSDVPSAED